MLTSFRQLLGMACVILAAIAGLAAVAAAAVADSAPWLGPDWTARRIVDVKSEGSRAAGDVAVAEFYTGGLLKPDGSDIRVTVRGRQLVGSRVLQVGPGDLVRVAFAVTPDETRYQVYHGNPKAAAPDAWEPQRGVLLEVRKWTGGPVEKLDQVKAAWAKAPVIGADLVSHISFGFNPFSDSETPAIARYTGWFVVPTPGTYQMDISTNGASWLVVDGQEVIAWPGNHPPSGHARRAKPVSLASGPHRVDLWNVNETGTMTSVVVWQAPGTEPFVPIPAKAFLPITKATLVESDLPGERLVADFFADNAGETWWPERYAIRIRFRNLTKPAVATSNVKCEWDFGDGQTSTLPAPTHIYLTPGAYTVTLKASRVADSNTFRAKVRVQRNWWRQTDPAIDPIGKYAEEIGQYNFAKLDLPGLTAAIGLFEHELQSKPLVVAAAEYIRRPGVEEGQVPLMGLLLGEHLRKLGQAAEAVVLYRQLEERLKKPPLKAELGVEAGETLLKDLRRWDDAEKEYQRILKTYATAGADPALRKAHAGLGDIWRHRGDAEKARQAYGAAAAIKVVSYPPNEAAVRVGTLARYVEEYTRTKQWEWAFKFLDEWAWEFPQDRLSGHWSYLRASALAARNDKPAALLEAMDLLSANPGSPYAVRLLMLAAEIHVALKEPDKARLMLQTAVEDYPEDPLQAEARKRLLALGGPLDDGGKPKRPGVGPAPGPSAEPKPPAPPSAPAPK